MTELQPTVLETPLIFTTKGNLPIASLKLSAHWDMTDNYVALTERYTDQTGEVVRESTHVQLLKGLDFDATQQRVA